MATHTRMAPKDRKTLVLEAAIKTAVKVGWRRMTRADIAKEAEVSDALVTTRLGSMATIRKIVMREAVKRNLSAVIAQGLAERDPIAMKAPDDVKAAARQAL